ncbi:hypothetical protein PoB_004155300 [Plakobranchus ocellatus]|uniref:Uncharacterized protein n=1 Tax=Plakobranchus ocellatus TaxID=259542 RepID=A0AAV4B7C2_9GAST|nr:hypothetical protein PoB_004155300 [Plakobranchus ocellatus]
MSRSIVIAPSLLAWLLVFNLTMRPPLPNLVTSRISSSRVDFRWILKDDLLATFADAFELINTNFLNGDHLEKVKTLIRVGMSSPFLLATETAPQTAYVQGFLESSDGEGPGGIFLDVMEQF